MLSCICAFCYLCGQRCIILEDIFSFTVMESSVYIFPMCLIVLGMISISLFHFYLLLCIVLGRGWVQFLVCSLKGFSTPQYLLLKRHFFLHCIYFIFYQKKTYHIHGDISQDTQIYSFDCRVYIPILSNFNNYSIVVEFEVWEGDVLIFFVPEIVLATRRGLLFQIHYRSV